LVTLLISPCFEDAALGGFLAEVENGSSVMLRACMFGRSQYHSMPRRPPQEVSGFTVAVPVSVKLERYRTQCGIALKPIG